MNSDTPLHYATITQLADALRRRIISSVELTELYLRRLETLGPELGALAYSMRPTALEQAKNADTLLAREIGGGKARSPLLGVPYGVKDLLATRHAPTEWGSPAHKGQHFDYDATVVAALEKAGAVLIGKLSMVELAGGGGYRYAAASSTGPGRTPWNKDHWAGGSSSGPGAAVAAGLTGYAIGSETWGSIVCPASFCGITGLRPTFGRVSRHGAMALSWTMDKLGPMARSAEDCGIVLEAIAGRDSRDRTTSKVSTFKLGKKRSVKGLRLGIVRPDYGKAPQAETEKAFENALDVLKKLGTVLTDATLPDLPVDEAASMIINIEGASAFEDVIRDKARFALLLDDEQKGGLLAGLVYPGVDYLKSQRIRTAAQEQTAELFTKYDALVAPGYLQVAPPIASSLDDYFTGSDNGLSALGNLTGIPALCVPLGPGQGHLPLGLQFVGDAYSEDLLLALGMAYQQETDWHRQRPPAPFG